MKTRHFLTRLTPLAAAALAVAAWTGTAEARPDRRHDDRPRYHRQHERPKFGLNISFGNRDFGVRARYDDRGRHRGRHHRKHRGSHGYWKRVYIDAVYRDYYDDCGRHRRVCVSPGYYKRVWVGGGHYGGY